MPTSATVGELLQSVPSMREFSAMDVPIKTGFKIKRILKRVQTDVDAGIEMQKAIVEKFTMKDEAGAPVHPKDEKGNDLLDQVKLTDVEGYNAAIKELFAQEVKFGFDKLHPEEFGEQGKVKSAVLLALDWLFTE